MKALILAAGEGTRMKPLTASLPKPLLPVAGKPCIRHTIESLKRSKILDLVFIVGFQRKTIRDYLENIQGINATFIEQKERLGTAHAIDMASSEMKEPFLCLNGDVLPSQRTIKEMISQFKGHGRSIMILSNVKDPSRYGVVRLDTATGLVKDITEKPKRSKNPLINTGIYLFTPRIFEAIARTDQSPRGEYEITESILKMKEKDRLMGQQIPDEYIDITYPWDLLNANGYLMSNMKAKISKGQIEDGVTVHGTLSLGKGTIVKSGTYIEGNVRIGGECQIGPGAYLRGSTSIGDRCHIGASVELKNSIIMDDTNIPHHNYVGDSIICRRCNLGSGTKVANLRLDDKPVISYARGKSMNTRIRKLGVIMGDDVKTGINTSINVGTVIGERSQTGPGSVVSGWFEPESRIF